MKRVLVTGSRDWEDRELLRMALADAWGWLSPAVLVHGACPTGADALADECWTHWGGAVERHPADWARHSTRAGPMRNREMVQLGADLCLAFIRNNSRGATHCALTAEAAGIQTRRYRA